nr:hypothetical protein Iba_scaffold306CG0010 [Ipomoea batatas]
MSNRQQRSKPPSMIKDGSNNCGCDESNRPPSFDRSSELPVLDDISPKPRVERIEKAFPFPAAMEICDEETSFYNGLSVARLRSVFGFVMRLQPPTSTAYCFLLSPPSTSATANSITLQILYTNRHNI